MSTIITLNDIDFKINLKEALRYMGAEGTKDETLITLAKKVSQQVYEIARPCGCYLKTNVEIKGNAIDFGFAEINSYSLAKTLENCSYVYIFSATIGVDFDRLLNRKLISSPMESLVLDSVGSAAIEGVCDEICNILFKECKAELKPRFSPGYGDLDISFQKNLIEVLDTKRKIGLSLTDGLMLTPIKSVTAIVGILNSGGKI